MEMFPMKRGRGCCAGLVVTAPRLSDMRLADALV